MDDKKHNPKQTEPDSGAVMSRGKGVGELQEGEGGETVMEADVTWGAQRTVQHAGGVLCNSTPEACMTL